MKKFYLVLTFVFMFIFTAIIVNFVSNANSKNVEDATENIYGIETKNYAIYPSNIIENNPTYVNKYVYNKRNICVQFPQIYFSNDYNEYDADIETRINKLLFALSFGNDDSYLIGRDIRELKEYRSNYSITKFDNDIFSIKYYGHLYSISHAKEFCYGITINTKTGEMVELSDFILVNESLIRGIEIGDIKYYSSPMYDKTFVTEAVSEFINSYCVFPDKDNLFFIDERSVYLIIPVVQGNSNYIVLEAPYPNV